MGLRSDIQADIGAAFDSDLADCAQPFTGSRTVNGDYDEVNDVQTTTTTTYSGRGVFTQYDLRQIDNIAILRTDELLIALQNEVTDKPKINDRINDLYEVIDVGQDPAAVIWQIQIRKT